jgi:TrmH family RNA methyltransferase
MMDPTITSFSNAKIKQARALRHVSARRESGLFLAEGIRPVGEAVAAVEAGAIAGQSVEAIFYAPEQLTSEFARGLIQEQSTKGVPCHATTGEVFESIANKENPQGILAIVRAGHTALDSLNPDNFPWGVALASPQDPGNIGTILRTIDAVTASGLLLLDSSADPYHPSAVRASMGAVFWHPIVTASFEAFASWAMQKGYTIYGTSEAAQASYLSVETYQPPMILLMGSEREGLTKEQEAACDWMVSLPMRGRVTSLNLAVATGVMLYAMLGD